MRKRCGVTVVLALVLAGCSWKLRSEQPEAEAEIMGLLDDQAVAWNRGDIEGYMGGYWKSEELVFAGASGVTRGWQATLGRYKKGYPDRGAMGKLRFEVERITLLGGDAAVVLGRWWLDREKDHPGGVFTLVVRRFPEGWRIVHDHTSSDEAAAGGGE